MKKVVLLQLLFILLAGLRSSLAQAPGVFNYQAVVRDAAGQGLANQLLDVRIQVYDDILDGVVVYVEEFPGVSTGAHGVMNLQVGRNGSVDLRELAWDEKPYYLNIQMRTAGSGAGYTNIAGQRTPLVSVPMALYAASAGQAGFADLAATALHTTFTDTASFAFGTDRADTAAFARSANIVTNYSLEGKGAAADSLRLARMGAQQGQVLQWQNGRWGPATISGGGSVLVDQLTLSGTGAAGNPLHVKPLGITNEEIANHAITSEKIQDGEIRAADLSDMDADIGDILVYRPSGWKAEAPSASGNSPWVQDGDNVYLETGELVGIGTTEPTAPLTVRGGVSVEHPFGGEMIGMNSTELQSPAIYLNDFPCQGPVTRTVEIVAGGGCPVSQGPAMLMLNGSYQQSMWSSSFWNLVNFDGHVESGFHQSGSGSGYVDVGGAFGSRNVRMTNLAGYPDNGFVGAYDEDDILQSAIFVNAQGEGELFATVKNFRVPNPRDPNTDIWYACLEGPEAAAYVRGTAALSAGEAFIPYPEHFQSVVNPETVTVILTPQDTDTYGLAVMQKQSDGVRVKELKGGTGNFKFDWEIKGVRKGHENYQVIRDKHYARPE